MNVLIFTTQLHQIGGYERLAVELAEDLNRLGVHADILSQYERDIPGVSASRLSAAGVPSVKFLGLRTHPSLFSVLGAIRRFRALIKTCEYDLVETSGFTPTLIASIALLGTRTRHVVGLHRNYSPELHGGVGYRLWRALLRSVVTIKFYAISQAVRDQWITYSRTDPARTVVVANSVNRLYFDPPPEERTALRKELGIVPDATVLLFVGRLLKSKGVDTLIDSAASVLVDANRYLLIVGRKDDSESADDARMLKEIRTRLDNGAWGNRIHFLGQRTDVPRIMSASDVLVHPARDEGFGLVLAEALAVGLPVIASDVGGIPEVLAGTDSVLIPAGDPVALTEAIQAVLERSSEERAAVIEKGKMRAEEFRGVRRAANMIRLYREMLQESGRGDQAAGRANPTEKVCQPFK